MNSANRSSGEESRDTALRRHRLLTRVGQGATLGVLGWVASWHLPLLIVPALSDLTLAPRSLLLAALLGMLVATVLRHAALRRCLWWLMGLTAGAIIVMSLSPWTATLRRGLMHSDPLQAADAVYILGPSALPNGELFPGFQTNAVHAFALLRQGYATHLVVPRVAPPTLLGLKSEATASPLPALRGQLQNFGIKATVEEVGSVSTTVDEARLVAQLVRTRGWKRVIVVSWPTHMRRVRATFEKAGVNVICSPGPDVELDPAHASAPDRCAAFQGWLHEELGYRLYRWRGWAE